MKKPTGKSGRKPLLDDEEAELWSIAATTIEPLKRAKSRVHAGLDRAKSDPLPPRTKNSDPAANAAQPARSSAGKPVAKSPAPVRPASPPQNPPIAEFDRRKVRKIRSGHVDIEARIDLHGMRQDQAHAALRAFIVRCQGKGQRWVLIITGKGKIAERDADAPFDMTQNRDRGVLKRNVPRWLEEADLRPMIVSFTTAAIQHGGEGALYVHLRTKKHQR